MKPSLSVILIAPLRYVTVEQTVAALLKQTICDRLELIFVTQKGVLLDPPAEQLAVFHSWQVVSVDRLTSVAQGHVAGMRAANAPIVALAEDHCFPEKGWAAALLNAYDDAYAAVAPAFYNANPTNAVSWVDMLLFYGPWLAPQQSGERTHLPGHNSSYRREVLLQLDQLDKLMEVEWFLHQELCRQGYRLYLTADAHTYHTNFARLTPWVTVVFLIGRKVAAYRAADWRGRRRLLYLLASPLIPLVRLRRCLRDAARAGLSKRERLKLLPTLMLGLLVDGAGQALGYSAGVGGSMDRLFDLEIDRHRFI